MFAKALPIFDDLALLEVVGRSLIGRLQFSPDRGANLERGSATEPARPPETCAGNRRPFPRTCWNAMHATPGLRASSRELLMRDDGSLQSVASIEPGLRPLSADHDARHNTHLVKTFDPGKYPGARGERVSLSQGCAGFAGLDVPTAELSEDGRISWVVERFDLKPDGATISHLRTAAP